MMRIEVKSWHVGSYFPSFPGRELRWCTESNNREMGPSFSAKEKASERGEICCLPMLKGTCRHWTIHEG